MRRSTVPEPERSGSARPDFTEILRALERPESCLADPALRAGALVREPDGTPLTFRGLYAEGAVFSLGRTRLALRFFRTEDPARRRRWAALEKWTARPDLPFLLPCRFEPRGFFLHGEAFPLVSMAWAEGELLGDFVAASLGDPARLRALRLSLRQLSRKLSDLGIAHGDIQARNVLVSEEGRRLFLVDYDGFFLPETASLGCADTGHWSFQHPERHALRPCDGRLDRFAFLLLDLVLAMLEEEPGLWAATKSGCDRFFFAREDFSDPGASPVFAELMRRRAFAPAIAFFAGVCRGPYGNVPELRALDRLLPARVRPA